MEKVRRIAESLVFLKTLVARTLSSLSVLDTETTVEGGLAAIKAAREVDARRSLALVVGFE